MYKAAAIFELREIHPQCDPGSELRLWRERDRSAKIINGMKKKKKKTSLHAQSAGGFCHIDFNVGAHGQGTQDSLCMVLCLSSSFQVPCGACVPVLAFALSANTRVVLLLIRTFKRCLYCGRIRCTKRYW
ncbi:unnamed protein product [Laminaria digitata]